MRCLLVGVLASTVLSLGGLQANATDAPAAHGQNVKSPFMRVYGFSLPPIGFVRFCERNPAECHKYSATSHARVELTPRRWQEMQAVNRFVNEDIEPVTDQELYGQVEFWTYPKRKGDCEDYVLMKRRLLIERGWPQGSLLITVVLDDNGDGHAILTARTSSGDFLLDNKHHDVFAWNALPYKFLKRQSYRDPSQWVSLYPQSDDASVAAFSLDPALKIKPGLEIDFSGNNQSSGEDETSQTN